MTDQSPDDSVNTEAVNDEPVRGEEVAPEQSGATPAAVDAPPGEPAEAPSDGEAAPAGSTADAVLAAERLGDLQRLQAEYVNYKRRVDRDRAVVQERVVRDVLESLLPTLDDIHAAREHGDLTGPFAAIADKLEGALGRYGLSRFGAKGEAFDPQQHEALMHAPWPADDADLPVGATATTVVTVLQPGYRAGEQVLRPARVAVADPE
ncbi:nucleotide exchange factor GrpE [Phycicoccus duodecadis]|uniref:Protein GrpE n=1 Tax=Phycicoccus duodecadis TaxID=173053 RepID=A0A2N3YLG1_9MICO|nr:nucleotide exchange factor GrpE [Phycicoccus duodecadis]PKW27696.1 molecular chaperone GrpE [Phycicoccus duodecadis]